MSRAGNHDQDGQGERGSLTSIADAPSRRSRTVTRRTPPRARATGPEPEATVESSTGFLKDFDFTATELGDVDADDVLEQHATPARPTPEGKAVPPSGAQTEPGFPVTLDRLADEVLETTGQPGEYDEIQAQLDRHHERRQAAPTRALPRGSADLAPAERSAAPRRAPHLTGQGAARRTARHQRGWWVAGAVGLVVVAVIAGTLFDSSSGHHPVAQQQLASLSAITVPDMLAREVITTSSATVADVKVAAAKAQADARARNRARAARAAVRAKAKARARAAAAAQARQRRHAAPVYAAGASASAPSSTTAPTITAPATPAPATSPTPAAPSYPSSTGSTSPTGSSTTAGSSRPGGTSSNGGSSSAPAGPTGIGSAGANCNPKCS